MTGTCTLINHHDKNTNLPQTPTTTTTTTVTTASTSAGLIRHPSISSINTAHTHNLSRHSDMNSIPTPDSGHSTMEEPLVLISPSPKRPVMSIIRRNRSPPRNEANEMVCDHPDCITKQPRETFKRRCEYNKHMDRHERPYKCHEPGCETSPGFTYSGGLLRHQREVHKMHLSSKQLMFCPYPGCNRSSGSGFTRKENLEEHKRRRHMGEMSRHPQEEEQQQQQQHYHHHHQGHPLSPPGGISAHIPPSHSLMSSLPMSHKRKRLPSPHSTEDEEGEGDFLTSQLMTANFEAQSTVKTLRTLITQKDQIIHWQQAEIQKLQRIITSLPQKALYNINAVNLVGLGGGMGEEVGRPVSSLGDDGHAAKMG